MNNWTWTGKQFDSLPSTIRCIMAEIKPDLVLEIGCDGGGSLDALLHTWKPKGLILCDIWDPTYLNHGFSNHDHLIPFLEAHEFPISQVMFLDGDSKETVPTLTAMKGTLDCIIIDGDHSAEGARADLVNTWPLLKKGGYLLFDDAPGHPEYPYLANVFYSWLPADATIIPETTGGATTILCQKSL